MELTQEQKDLVEENINLVYAMINKLNVVGDEDAVQEGIMGLCVASTRYDCEKSRFSTFATSYIRGYILQYINKNRIIKPGRKYGVYTSPDTVFCDEVDFTDDNNYVDKLLTECSIQDKLSRVDDSYKILYQMILEGMTQVKMAKVLNCTQSTIINRIKKLRKILEDVK